MLTTVTILVCLGALFVLVRPSLIASDYWRATATPLASIIGSGFLVSVPILRDVVGQWAVFPMIGLLIVAYLIGAAIRDNIAHVEPLVQNGDAAVPVTAAERLSHLALSFSYFVSVAYYLVLFATFLLKSFGVADPQLAKLIVTGVLLAIAIIGAWRGFHAVEGLEIYAVSIKLAVIAGLLAALALFDALSLIGAAPGDYDISGHFDLAELPVLMGLLILVQGFETSRFLGADYPADLRISTMKAAQLLSAAIYITFFVLMIPLMGGDSQETGVAAIVDIVQPVALVLPLLITIGALASQSSAAVADAIGAGGLLNDITKGRIPVRYTYPWIAGISAIVTWETDVFSLITLASRCFAFYYALQCLVATLSANRRGESWRAGSFGLLMLLCTAIVIFGTPAEGG
jgi:hypothetical protein